LQISKQTCECGVWL